LTSRLSSLISFPTRRSSDLMFDEKGRVWFTSVIRPPENPAFCKEGSSHPSAKLFPLERSGRQLSFYDPKSKQFTLIDTCFSGKRDRKSTRLNSSHRTISYAV